jgi:hypothetical protein
VRWILAATLVASVATLAAGTARAADDVLRGPRIGFVPSVGFGFTEFTGQTSHFSSSVADTSLAIEFIVDAGRWGVFARGGYVTSGPSGLWTAPIGALGGTYRFQGDGEEEWGMVGRFGALYQRWGANTAGCSVTWFVPNSCSDYLPPPTPGLILATPAQSYQTTIDNVGLMGGVSFEVPVEPAFVALGAELSATADVDHTSPGFALSGLLTLSIAFRTHVYDRLGGQLSPRRHYNRN